MPDQPELPITRRAARAILFDGEGRVVLFKRTKPGRDPYWTTPGGGVEPADASLEATLRRELREELGAEVSGISRVFLHTAPSHSGSGLHVHHFFIARLEKLDPSLRDGPEFLNPANGVYDIHRVSLDSDDIAAIDLRPAILKEFILTNRHALLDEVAL
ncbi:MAG: NUDIX domain-containing protein [Trebonia sp.]